MKKSWLLALTGTALAVTFYPTFVWMAARFTEADSYYSHGFLVPLISSYLLWRERRALASLPVSSSPAGLALVALGLAMHIAAGVVFRVGFISGLSLILVLIGLTLYLYGPKVARAALFPLLFLVFMVPAPKVIIIGFSFKLKMMAAAAAGKILALTPLRFEQYGSVIHLPTGALTVDNECSGINSLISIVMLSVLFAYFMAGSVLRRGLFVVASLPIAVAANITRILCLVLIAYVYGPAAATAGPLHYGAGIALWIVALILLWLVWSMFTWRHQNADSR